MQLFQYKVKKKCNYQIKLTNVSIDFNKTYLICMDLEISIAKLVWHSRNYLTEFKYGITIIENEPSNSAVFIVLPFSTK